MLKDFHFHIAQWNNMKTSTSGECDDLYAIPQKKKVNKTKPTQQSRDSHRLEFCEMSCNLINLYNFMDVPNMQCFQQ